MPEKKKEKIVYRKESKKLALMRYNVRRHIVLDFECYELRVKASLALKSKQVFERILPTIRISNLTREFIIAEIKTELSRIDELRSADCTIEIFAVYRGGRHSDSLRYLGQLDFFFEHFESYDTIRSSYKDATTYAEQPKKSDFIPQRL